MVEGRLFPAHPFISQRPQEIDQLDFCGTAGRTFQRDDVIYEGIQVVHVGFAEIAAADVEIDHLHQSDHAAVMHVGSGQFDVAQARGLECAFDGNPLDITQVRRTDQGRRGQEVGDTAWRGHEGRV